MPDAKVFFRLREKSRQCWWTVKGLRAARSGPGGRSDCSRERRRRFADHPVVLAAPLPVLLDKCSAATDWPSSPTATAVGVIAAVVQFLRLARWPFLVPPWPGSTTILHQPRRREATVVRRCPARLVNPQ